MHCSNEVLDIPIYNLNVLFLTLLAVAEPLDLDIPGADFFISGEVTNTVLAHRVDAEPMAQKKFHGCSKCQ